MKLTRFIVKDPDPNRPKKINLGAYLEIEADVLMNGKIHTDHNRLKVKNITD